MAQELTHLDDIADTPELWPVTHREQVADCHVFQVWRDTVTTPDGDEIVRGYVHHPGAVAVIALDDDDRVAVVRQYRHPVGMRLLEAPAGLLDVAGEDRWSAARRELAEEAQLAADDWRVLLDHTASAGSSQESIRIFLARGLRPTPRPDGFVVEGEEADMDVCWVALDDLVAGFLAGRLHNGTLGLGVLALHAARTTGLLAELRPADAEFVLGEAKAAHDAQHPC